MPCRTSRCPRSNNISSTGTELRITTSCPSCNAVKSASSIYQTCEEARQRRIVACENAHGETLSLKWLCGRTRCDEIAEEEWMQVCREKEKQIKSPSTT